LRLPPIDARADIVIMAAVRAAVRPARCWRKKAGAYCCLKKMCTHAFTSGESLLPLNLPLFEQLGCAPAVKKVGLVKNSVRFSFDGT
jgi:hypothetical protein